MYMKKLASLLILVGLAMNVSGQDQPKSLKEAMDMAGARWMIGDWEREGSDGTPRQLSLKWALQDESAISIHASGGRMQYHGVIGLNPASGKVVGKSFGVGSVIDAEWDLKSADGKIVEKITISGMQDGEPLQMTFARSYRKVDDKTAETTFHRVSDTGEIGEALMTQTLKRKK